MGSPNRGEGSPRQAMESQDNKVVVETPGLDVRRELLTAAIRRTSYDLGWQLSVVSPNCAPLDMVFLDETQVALIIDEDGDGRIEYDEYVKWKRQDSGKYNEKENAFAAAMLRCGLRSGHGQN